MNNELISIIVPIYNSEQYLAECVDSIIGQTYNNLEIILVDDGSTDSSGEICDEYAKKDNRIRVIHKKNGGQQDARSAGIAIAKGAFIGFVDSDDWIDADMYENLYRNIDLCDLATSGLWCYDKNGVKRKIVDALDAGIYDAQGKDFCENLIVFTGDTEGGMYGGILNNIWNKLFKASIVKESYASVNVNVKNGEDLLFVITYALMCRKVVITHECYYHYRYNSLSVSHKKNPDYLTEMNMFYKVLDRALVEHVFEKTLRDQLNRLLLYLVCAHTSSKMQMGIELYYPQYVFPQNDLLSGKNIVLFGRGKVGQSYYRNWKDSDSIRVVQWIDSLPSTNEILGRKVHKAEEIIQDGYDYVVCAVLDQKKADEMRKQLIDYGVKEEVILWKKPEDIYKKFYLIR